jgi:hypothetical protein
MLAAALTPPLGVEVSGVEDWLDDAVIARCLEALKWRGVLLARGRASTTRRSSRSADGSARS